MLWPLAHRERQAEPHSSPAPLLPQPEHEDVLNRTLAA